MSQKNKRAIGIQVNSGGSVNVSGDIVGRDKINKTTYSYRTNFVDLTSWQETMLGEIKKGEYS